MGWMRNQDIKDQKRTQALRDFAQASTLAAQHHLRFSRTNDVQYQLKGKWLCGTPWLINVYPGNCRLYHDPQKIAPFLKVSSDWGLLNVIQSAIKAIHTTQSKEQFMRWQKDKLIHVESIPGADESMFDVRIKTGQEPGMFTIFAGDNDEEGLTLSLAELKRFTQKAGDYHKEAVRASHPPIS